MNDTPNSIRIAFALGLLATGVGVATMFSGNDDEAASVAEATDSADAEKPAAKRPTSAGVWGDDESDSPSEQSESSEGPPRSSDDGGWGSDSNDQPSIQSGGDSSDQSESSGGNEPGLRPGPDVPNDVPGGASGRVEGI